MVNNKLQVVSIREPARVPPEKPEKIASGCSADPKEGHRLISAFWQINDAGKRQWLIAMAERMARE